MGSEEKVRDCYKIPDDGPALECIKQVIKQTRNEPGCRPRMILLVQENCAGCAEEKARYKADIESGLVEMVDVYSPEGLEIANRNGVESVPALLVLDCKNIAIE